MYGKTPILHLNRFERSGVNQFGLLPKAAYDFKNPTLLVNFGRGTEENSLATRRAQRFRDPDSDTIFQGNAQGKAMAKMLGLSSGEHSLAFCQDETFALRLCMARGTSNCARENAALTSCLAQAAPLKSAIRDVGAKFRDWYIQSVSDNGTVWFQHRKQDWQHYYWQEKLMWRRAQGGKAFGRHKKVLYWNAKSTNADTKFARFSRLPVNR